MKRATRPRLTNIAANSSDGCGKLAEQIGDATTAYVIERALYDVSVSPCESAQAGGRTYPGRLCGAAPSGIRRDKFLF